MGEQPGQPHGGLRAPCHHLCWVWGGRGGSWRGKVWKLLGKHCKGGLSRTLSWGSAWGSWSCLTAPTTQQGQQQGRISGIGKGLIPNRAAPASRCVTCVAVLSSPFSLPLSTSLQREDCRAAKFQFKTPGGKMARKLIPGIHVWLFGLQQKAGEAQQGGFPDATTIFPDLWQLSWGA